MSSYNMTSPSSGEVKVRVRLGRGSERSWATRYLGLKLLRKSRKSFIVSARLTVVPSGSSDEGAAGADRDRLGAEDGGKDMCVPSERGPASVSASLACQTRREAKGG